jgi:hypothetical protein
MTAKLPVIRDNRSSKTETFEKTLFKAADKLRKI